MTGSQVQCEWRVTGMDCGSCAAKVRGAVERLPGVAEVNIGLMTERLRLTLDERQTPAERVEAAVRALGYAIAPSAATNEAPLIRTSLASARLQGSGEQTAARKPQRGLRAFRIGWQGTSKGRLVIATGVLLAAAWAIDLLLAPDLARGAFILATVLGLVPIARKAFAMLRAGMPFTIEALMTVAATGALVIGAAEEAALVVFLFAIGELLERLAANKAREGIRALASLVPKIALLEVGGRTREVPAETLEIGDTVLVRPGDRVPCDGEVVEGVSGVDESPVTGESIPTLKEPGADVFAGSINSEAVLRVRVARAANDNTIARIVRLVEEAEIARAPTERFIDRFSRYYMPAIVAAAVLVALIPPLALGWPWTESAYRALALLLIGCPCALVISVPASIASALSAGARSGLLMKGGAVIESAARTTHVAFDKTGTLTHGRPHVTDLVTLCGTDADVLSLAAAVESGSSHPVAEAIRAKADAADVAPASYVNARVLPGKGAEADIGGELVAVGSPRLAEEHGAMTERLRDQVASLEADGQTVVIVLRGEAPLGLIAIRDEPRADAGEAVRQLRSMGIASVMLTGDNRRTAAAIASRLGIDHRAELLPQDKLAAIRQMTAEARVMMVGDGINDAPALAAAHVGVAMGSGTDVALETAQAAILRNRVTDTASMIRLTRATMAIIRQNIAIALGLKAVFLVTTVAGVTGLWIAILADTGATVLVTLNALRLLLINLDQKTSTERVRKSRRSVRQDGEASIITD
ncbi:MAG: heavy metal translocating P-type ATPase [Pseudomonadota bacterium]